MLKKSFAISCLFTVAAECIAGETNLYSINTGSFVYHLQNNNGQYTENFDNKFLSVERRFPDDQRYSLLAGTMKNSFNDRCIALGLRRDWMSNDSGWVFKGVYGYVGEFFFDAFSQCGNDGSYNKFKDATGIGFSPYIYHAVQYNLTSYFGIESGIIFPSIFAIGAQWSFR
ncbi:hypothetical protein AV650_28260 (plasmid) [Serratia fonticola]|nr:hypothetical protein AV650_28260 [Serratia fonticola]